MDFDAENNSIFEGLGSQNPTPPQMPLPPLEPPKPSLLGSLLNNLMDKIDENRAKKIEEQVNKSLSEFTDENLETLLVLKSFGCKLKILDNNTTEIYSEEFNIRGVMRTVDDKVEADESAKKIFRMIATIVGGGQRIEDILSKYEEEEFYPIGQIEQLDVVYKGTPIKASVGRLANPKGEIRTITFYKGYEINLEEDEAAQE